MLSFLISQCLTHRALSHQRVSDELIFTALITEHYHCDARIDLVLDGQTVVRQVSHCVTYCITLTLTEETHFPPDFLSLFSILKIEDGES